MEVEAASGGNAASLAEINDIKGLDGAVSANAAVGKPQLASITAVVGDILINPNGGMVVEVENALEVEVFTDEVFAVEDG